MTKEYVSPVIYVERFAVNEYIASCPTTMHAIGCGGVEYKLVFNGDVPAIGYGRGAMIEGSGDGVTAYNCGGGDWMILGTVQAGHTYGDAQHDPVGEWQVHTSGDHLQCDNENHIETIKGYPSMSEYTQHHHFTQVAIHDAS